MKEVGGSTSDKPNSFDRRGLLRNLMGVGLLSVGLSRPVRTQEIGQGNGIWRFETDDYMGSSPTVVNGIIYIGSNDGSLYALDAETGESEWTFSDPNQQIRSSPTVTNDSVYFSTSSSPEHGGQTYALDSASGELNWVSEIGSESRASPTVANGTVYVPAEGTADRMGGLYALDAETGSEEWSFEDSDGVTLYGASPVLVDGTLYIGSGGNTGQVYAIDAGSGDQIWVSDTPDGQVRTVPAVSDGTIYVSAGLGVDDQPDDQTLYALDGETGELEWTFETNGKPMSPTVNDGTVYVGTGNNWGTLHAVDTISGEEQWQYQGRERDRSIVVSSPTVADDTVFFAGVFGIVALDAATGDMQWTFEPPNSYTNTGSSATVVDGTVFVALDALYAVDAGVEGSSKDSRVLQGVLGHHHTWAGESDQSLEMVVSYQAGGGDTSDSSTSGSGSSDNTTGSAAGGGTADTPRSDRSENSINNTEFETATAVFRRFSNVENSQLILGLAGISGISAAYAGYRTFRSNDETGKTTPEQAKDGIVENASVASEYTPTITQYDDVEVQGTIREQNGFQIQGATTANHRLWMVSPVSEAGKTIATPDVERFSKLAESWAGMAAHPNLLSVYATGDEPLPWAAIEPTGDSSLSERVDGLTLAETVKILVKVCEAVHHVQRYGLSYDQLSLDSVLVSNNGDVQLIGFLDHLIADTVVYSLPRSSEDPETEQAEVYRLGALAYEALTGRRPSHPDPTPSAETEKSVPTGFEEILASSLAESPDTRYETVLHFRDELQKLSDRHGLV